MLSVRSKMRSFFLFLCLGTSSAAALAGPSVLQVSPVPQSLDALTAPDIVIQFDQPLDTTSVNDQTVMVFGRWAGVCPGEITFENNDRRIRFVPSKSFSAGEWITVSLSRGIRNAIGENMDAGYAWNFWTATENGRFDLQELDRIEVRRPGEGLIRVYGAYAGDLDGDGSHDFTVPCEDASDVRVFLNDGSGNYGDFTIYTVPPESNPSTNEGADFNRDGFIDFAVGNIHGGTVSVFFGDGVGGFEPAATYPADGGTRGLSVLDIEGDGDFDIVTANRDGDDMSVLPNAGDGTFPLSTDFDPGLGNETSCAAADANGDGILDLFVGGYSSREIAILLGDGDGGFSMSSREDAGGNAWMIAVGDVDGNGSVDVVSANAGQNSFSLLRGDGAGGLGAAEQYDTGGFPLAIDLGDIDGDGDLDLVTSNFSSGTWTLFENDGAGVFAYNRTLEAQSAGSCAVFHDRDRDGDLDMTGIDEIADLLFLFENAGPVLIDEDPAFVPIEPNHAGVRVLTHKILIRE